MFLCLRNPNPFTTCHETSVICLPAFLCFAVSPAERRFERRGAAAPCGRQGARRLPDGVHRSCHGPVLRFARRDSPPGHGSVSPASTWTGITASECSIWPCCGWPTVSGRPVRRFRRTADRLCPFGLPEFGVTQGEDHEPYHFLRKFNELDHCGAECAAMIELAARRPAKTEAYAPYIERLRSISVTDRPVFPDGTLVRTWPHRHTLWADDLYMGLSFMSRYGGRFADRAMLRDAVRQVGRFHHYLWNPATELLYHGYYGDLERTAGAHWGRCNGWVMLATVQLYGRPACRGPRPAAVAGAARTTDRRRGETPVRFRAVASAARPGGFLRGELLFGDFRLLPGARLCEGWIDIRYASAALKGWEGLCREKDHAGRGPARHLRGYGHRQRHAFLLQPSEG